MLLPTTTTPRPAVGDISREQLNIRDLPLFLFFLHRENPARSARLRRRSTARGIHHTDTPPRLSARISTRPRKGSNDCLVFARIKRDGQALFACCNALPSPAIKPTLIHWQQQIEEEKKTTYYKKGDEFPLEMSANKDGAFFLHEADDDDRTKSRRRRTPETVCYCGGSYTPAELNTRTL